VLFPIEVEASDIPPIPGLSYLPGYIDAVAELELVVAIDSQPWDTSWERRRQLYGWSYGRDEGPPTPIPSWGVALIERMRRNGIGEQPFDQMLVKEYLPGQGIALHRDYEPFDRTVVALSLLSPVVMDFRRASDGRRESLLLQRCSLLILADEARYQWQHGIARRKTDRWRDLKFPRARRLSITFRRRKL
jgi:alkylated DNA repair dioxygenase AlkB